MYNYFVHVPKLAKPNKRQVETKFEHEMKEIEVNLRRAMKELETKLGHDMKALESKLLIKLSGVIIAAGGFMLDY